ncbi:MAG: DUF4249 domain-containing protein [Bacteroidales bacterium]|nr:DUF4249 domain-containing protein [Bacteroidales bacterium]
MKNINTNSIIYSLLISISLIACEKDSNVEVPNVKPELVTACFISPTADQTTLQLSWSAPIFHNTVHEQPIEEDAHVYIFDGANKHQLLFNSIKESYEISKSQLQIVAGRKYTLTVESSKSETLTAETIIPVKPKFSIAFQSYDSVHSPYDSPQRFDYRYFVKLNISNEEDKAYYRIAAWGKSKYLGYKQILSITPTNGENKIYHGDYSGTLIFVRSAEPEERLTDIYINLHKVDETYYRYHNALENYQGSDLFSEPTLVYSNVEHGLGVFCSYNNLMDSVAVK